MRFHSSRDATHRVSIEETLWQGLAPDGGLYLPAELPPVDQEVLAGLTTLPALGARLLAPFFEGSALASELETICAEALNFPVPLKTLRGEPAPLALLELFHGPTAAFKDVGARFLATCLSRLRSDHDLVRTILVATSGDTGSAVAAGFHGRAGFRVVILFPEGQVSPRQQHQLSCWGDNVESFAVRGNFDDCQRLAKEAFRDPDLSERHHLSSANSINLGRLLPQMVHHASAALAFERDHSRPANVIVPTGNLGNAVACLWARASGLPISEVILATNANRPIPDWMETGVFAARKSIPTHASAMDVGDPSNLERLLAQSAAGVPLTEKLSACAVLDPQIEESIRATEQRFGIAVCPHTATAFRIHGDLPPERQAQGWVLVSTAHAAKFETIVEPLVGRAVPVPPALAELLSRPSAFKVIDPELSALRALLS